MFHGKRSFNHLSGYFLLAIKTHKHLFTDFVRFPDPDLRQKDQYCDKRFIKIILRENSIFTIYNQVT